jgi:hypothetical protein
MHQRVGLGSRPIRRPICLAATVAVLVFLAGCTAPSELPEPETTEGLTPSQTSLSRPYVPEPKTDPEQSPAPPPDTSDKRPANGSSSPLHTSWSLAKDGWAPIEEARIFPGVQVLSWHGDCTANFVFTDPNGTTVYIGTAAHCGVDANNSPDNAGQSQCDKTRISTDPEASLAFFGDNLTWGNMSEPHGHYVYNSWIQMDQAGEEDGVRCVYNDFALIEVAAQFRHLVNPSVQGWGGPVGNLSLQEAGKLYTTGGTIFRTSPRLQDWAGIPPAQEWTRAREGYVNPHRVGPPEAGNWSGSGYFPGLCLPGDSGSPVLGADGAALGVVHAIVAGNALGCEFVLVNAALAYMAQHVSLPVVRHDGTEPFQGGVLPG